MNAIAEGWVFGRIAGLGGLVWLALVATSGCGAGACEVCEVNPLAESAYCAGGCIALERWDQNCIGSFKTQQCEACGDVYTAVFLGDENTLFYDANDEPVAEVALSGGTGQCADTWYGRDLSQCESVGPVETIYCNSGVE